MLEESHWNRFVVRVVVAEEDVVIIPVVAADNIGITGNGGFVRNGTASYGPGRD